MILIRLLGNCKKATGYSFLEYEKYPASINEILSFLNKSASGQNDVFRHGNILVVVNGIDSSLLDLNGSLVQDGDIVTVVPIVHGG